MPAGSATQRKPLLICMLPARNAASDLPGYLACVETFCDAVVALDDGSTDETHDILAAHPLVRVLLRNPVRDDYRGWDDAANRNRLIAAALELDPEWLISLDADELVDEKDATDLRRFLQTDAIPGFAYGFRHVPMRQDGTHFLPKYQWVYRLFSADQGQRFPNQKLHFVPVPMSIPRHRWIRTTLRIQHFGGMTEERRLVRFNKYLQADPNRTYQQDYQHLLDTPSASELRVWEPRPDSIPVLLAGSEADGEGGAAVPDPSTPALSAIIIAQNDERTIEETVASVVNQEVSEPFEVILVASGSDRTADVVRAAFPQVTVVELPGKALPGEARNAGLRVARGVFVSFPGSHVKLLPGSLEARLRAHRRGYAMVTGVTVNGTLTPAGWASYFLDHAEGLPGHAPAELNGPPAHCSYARLPLLEVGGFPEGVRTAEDTSVNRALVDRGYVALRDPAIRFVHRSPCVSVEALVRHHFHRGRGLGRMLVGRHASDGHMLDRAFVERRLVRALPDRVHRIERSLGHARRELREEYDRVRFLVALGALSSICGTWYELLRPGKGKLELLFGIPRQTLLIVERRDDGIAMELVNIDHLSGAVHRQPVHAGLRIPVGDGAIMPGSPWDQRIVPPPNERQSLRRAASEALGVDRAEVIVNEDPGLRLIDADPSATPWTLVDRARRVALILGATRRGTVWSSLPAWGILRLAIRGTTEPE